MKKYIFLLLILAACGSDNDPKPIYSIDPEFQAQVDEFYAQASARGYGELPKENLVIKRLPDGYQDPDTEVFVNAKAYKKSGQNIIAIKALIPVNCREAVVFRELGHLLLGKPYSPDNTKIMSEDFNPCQYVHVDGGFYPEREEYLAELFAN